MKDILTPLNDVIAYAKAQGADAADAIIFDSTDIAVSIRKGEPEDIERAESGGLGLRVFVGEKSSIVSSTDLTKDALEEACDRAIAMAKASLDDPHTKLADASLLSQENHALDLADASEPDIDWMQAQCRSVEEAALSHEGITNSEGAEASASRNRIALATSEGFAKEYATSSCSLSVSVIAGEGDKMERDYAYSVTRHRDDLRDAVEIGHEAAERTLRRLNPKKMSTQSVPIIFDRRISRSLLSNFASAISGNAIARGTSFLKGDMGKSLFRDNVRIYDDPHRVRGLGSKPFDAEGVANGKRALIDGGVLQSWILDTRSASKLGLKTTGNAVRGIGSGPNPSATNLYMEAGEQSVEEMIAEIDSGLYLTEAFGMGVNLVTGDYSQGASGIWIEKGELAYPVSELTIAGHLRDMFAQATPANDLAFDFATNAPTIRIDQMMVAGV
ncbi:MAG: metallopeptidase TldD-related protein [Rickettsiales bacterium]|nr:metallopeptidase TldD-related protein [Rickettsiales bacterium]